MKKYDYLIIGGGMTADAAIKGIRELDKEGSIGLLCRESEPPYRRPPLSKDLWSGDKDVEDISCGTAQYDVDILLGHAAEKIDPSAHNVDAGGDVFNYKRLLIATGGIPRQLSFDDEGVNYYRTLADYLNLLRAQAEKNRFAVIGAGFIGSEIAAALTNKGKQVTMVFPEEFIGAGTLPPAVAQELSNLYVEKGVTLLPGLKLSGLECGPETYRLLLENGRKIEVDGVVAGIGIEPATELAENAGLEVDDGIVVNGMLLTTHKDIFAAGDVARFHNKHLSTSLRCEHEDNAVSMGRMAGRNMAGSHDIYDHLPYFYSDLFDAGYEAVGELNADLQLTGMWKGIDEKGAWAYHTNGSVRGVLFWNMFGKIDRGRALIAQNKSWTDGELEVHLKNLISKS
jgi:NADPH-dependent 2,4-dienoyl-CoA reductase/sulfur reductase-like enzyme